MPGVSHPRFSCPVMAFLEGNQAVNSSASLQASYNLPNEILLVCMTLTAPSGVARVWRAIFDPLSRGGKMRAQINRWKRRVSHLVTYDDQPILEANDFGSPGSSEQRA